MPPTRILDGFVSYFGCDEETEEGIDAFHYGQYRLEILTREWNEISREHAMSLCPQLFTGDQLNKDEEDDLFDE